MTLSCGAHTGRGALVRSPFIRLSPWLMLNVSLPLPIILLGHGCDDSVTSVLQNIRWLNLHVAVPTSTAASRVACLSSPRAVHDPTIYIRVLALSWTARL